MKKYKSSNKFHINGMDSVATDSEIIMIEHIT